MKVKEFRKLSDEDLKEELENLRMLLMKTYTFFGKEKIKDKDLGIKGSVKQGVKTKMQREIKKNIARCKTILREREGEIR